MLVFNTLFKHIKLLLLHLKGFIIKLKNASRKCVGAFLNLAAFAYSILLIFLKRSCSAAVEAFEAVGPRLGPVARVAFKTVFLTAAALLFTVTVKTYFFQKIMASEMLKMLGGDVAVTGVDLGLTEFSHDSVNIRGLSHKSESFSLNVGRIEVTYDFMESMKERAKIQILTFKKPEFRVGDFKGLMALLFESKASGIKNYDFLLKLPKVSLDGGVIEFAGGGWALENLDCEITPLTDYIVYIKSKAGFKNSGCTLELGVTVNFEAGTVKYNGKLLSAGLGQAERFINAFFAAGAVTGVKGFADCEFSGSFSATGGESVSRLKLRPRDCEFGLAKAPGRRIAVREAEASLALRTSYLEISGYEISVRGAKLAIGDREIIFDGAMDGSGSALRVSSPRLGAADLEPFFGPMPGFFAFGAPLEFGVDVSLRNGRYDAGIIVRPFVVPAPANLPEVKAVRGELLLRGRTGVAFADGFDSLDGGMTLCVGDGGTIETRVSSRGPREFSFEAAGLAAGSVSFKNGGTLIEAVVERVCVPKAVHAGASAKIAVDLATFRFDARLSRIGPEELSFLPGLFANAAAGLPREFLRSYDAAASGYIERDRLIAHYCVTAAPPQAKTASKNTKAQNAQPLAAGVFSAANSAAGFSFNLKAAGNLADAVDLSGHNNYKFYQLVRKKIFNQDTVLNLSASGGRLSRLTVEAPLLKIDYGFDGKVAVEYRYGGFLTLNGTFHMSEKRFTASALLSAEKMPATLAAAVKYLGVSEFGIDYTGGLLKISSASGRKEGALYFELRSSGLHNIAHSKISLDNVIIETADFSYNGAAEIDFNSQAYSLDGKLVPTGVLAGIPALKEIVGGFAVGLSGSFRDPGAGEKPQMRVKLKSDPILSAVRLVSDLKVVFGEGICFDELKLTDVPGSSDLARATVDLRRDTVSGVDYYYVSYRSEKLKEFILSLKKNALAGEGFRQALKAIAPFKMSELEKYLEMVECHIASAGFAGSLTVRNAALAGHEFELSVRLNNGMNLSAAFALDGANGYKTRLMNYSLAGVTYKGECSLDVAAGKAGARFRNVKIPVAEALELATGEKNDIGGTMVADSFLEFDNGALSFESKIKITNARIDAEKLGKLLLNDKKKNGGDALNLNIDISLGESCYIYNQVVYALAEGSVQVKGTPASPLVSGNIDIVRGKINYLNRSFDIDSGGFKLSTLKNVSKPIDKYQGNKSFSLTVPDGHFSENPEKTIAGASKYSFRLAPETLSNQGAGGKSAIELSTNITASTRVDDYQIYLTIAAGLNRLNAYLTSKPELSSESIHMLLYGVKPDAASASGGGEQLTSDKFIDVINNQLQDAIYQKLSDSLEKKLNLDEVRINTYTAGGVTSLGGRIGGKSEGQNELLRNFGHYTDVEVKIGKYVDPALFLSYSKNLYSPRSDSLGMEYKVRKKLFVDGRVNQNLEYRLGAKYGIPF